MCNCITLWFLFQESAFCGMFFQPSNLPLAEISATVFFVIPLLAIGVQYTRMGKEIAKSTKKSLGKGLKGSVHRDSARNSHSNRTIFRMLGKKQYTIFFYFMQKFWRAIYKGLKIAQCRCSAFIALWKFLGKMQFSQKGIYYVSRFTKF